jgi:hypothetical protein
MGGQATWSPQSSGKIAIETLKSICFITLLFWNIFS